MNEPYPFTRFPEELLGWAIRVDYPEHAKRMHDLFWDENRHSEFLNSVRAEMQTMRNPDWEFMFRHLELTERKPNGTVWLKDNLDEETQFLLEVKQWMRENSA